jgi:tetratricopeptide (TPR) repeat protein
LDFYAEIKAFKENGEYYLLDKHITILEAKLTKKNPSQDMRYFTLNLAFLLRCKAKIINFKNKNKDKNKNKEKAKLIYQKAIEYLNKLDVKDFEVQSELALHHLGLCHLENSSSQKQSLLATAATFMDFNVQTLIQVHWYLVRAKLARDERVDPMSYLDKANEIIKNYFKNDENHLSLEYMIVLGKVLIDQGNYDYAKEIYLRISQVIDILGFSNKPFILHINSFIEDKLDEYSKYSEFNETNSRRYKKNKDKVVSIIKIKELFDPYLDDSMKIKFSPFIDNYNRYQESLKSVDTQPEIARSVGRGHLFHQPVRDGSAEFKSDQVAIAPPARQATPFCCNIM